MFKYFIKILANEKRMTEKISTEVNNKAILVLVCIYLIDTLLYDLKSSLTESGLYKQNYKFRINNYHNKIGTLHDKVYKELNITNSDKQDLSQKTHIAIGDFLYNEIIKQFNTTNYVVSFSLINELVKLINETIVISLRDFNLNHINSVVNNIPDLNITQINCKNELETIIYYDYDSV